jgi:site-specific DNA-methyltransferase (adenine-specific)
VIEPVYQSDLCTVYHGDCLDVLPELDDVSAVITDPPYNVGLKYTGDGTEDSRSDYAEWCRSWFAHCRRLANAVAISCGQANVDVWAAIESPDWWLAWWKPAAMGRCTVGFNNWEPIAFWGKVRRLGCDVIRAGIKPDPGLDGHPCPKPLEWAARQVLMMTSPGDIVLDPFAGTGTTAVACVQTGRRCVLIEREAAYVEIAVRRIKEVEGVGSLFEKASSPLVALGG